MKSTSVTDLRRNLQAWLSLVARGERVQVTSHGRAIAEILPPHRQRTRRRRREQCSEAASCVFRIRSSPPSILPNGRCTTIDWSLPMVLLDTHALIGGWPNRIGSPAGRDGSSRRLSRDAGLAGFRQQRCSRSPHWYGASGSRSACPSTPGSQRSSNFPNSPFSPSRPMLRRGPAVLAGRPMAIPSTG